MKQISESLSQEHDQLFREAVAIIKPLLPTNDRAAPGESDRQSLLKACSMLRRVLEINRVNWAAMWFYGLARRALGEEESAYESLKGARLINPASRDIGNEFVIQCIRCGLGQESVEASTQLLAKFPNDAAVISNHAIAQLIAGDVAAAARAARIALALDANDAVTRRVSELIAKVASGESPRPNRWPP